MQLINKAKGIISDVFTYWNHPPAGKYVPYKGIFGYSFGGIGAYMIITLGTACLLSANNTLLTMTLGVKPTHMYIMYVICVIANIPLTGIRASIIDNTRNKAGKYRPYILTMAVPSALICLAMVWIPYGSFSEISFLQGEIFGESKAYVAKCAIIFVLNLLLHFFYYFFYDAYENLIHVLSPDSQERANVQSVKSVVYSFAPTVVNFISPLIAEHIFHSNTTDIRVYRLLYPILTVLGLLLCIVVYKNTEEKIVQARTHVVQIKFIDALRAVAKNKYFWIISLAGWIGFLESSYSNILAWLYNYGGACNANEYSIIVTVYGNASLWGMLLAPFAIKRWGKKAVLIVTNLFNILFILMMLPCCQDITKATIWLVMGCLWLNALMGSFAHILNPAIQADIRDYQQYKTGERIDGMFSAVATIGTVITLATSSVLPFIYERSGITEENALKVTSDPNIVNRVLVDGRTIAEVLAEQFAKGQDNYSNATSALYDTNILLNLLQILIVLAAFGALMNVIPYIWYDFNERKQKSVVRVLKVRAMFEDYGNNVTNDSGLVEGIDIITKSKEMCNAEPKLLSKKSYKGITDKEEKKAAKKQYFSDKDYNNEIEIAKFVCNELDRFSTPVGKFQLSQAGIIRSQGINSILHTTKNEVKTELTHAKAMTKNSAEEKEMRKTAIENAKKKKTAVSAVKKYFKDVNELVQPDFSDLDRMYDREDEINKEMKALYLELDDIKKAKDRTRKAETEQKIASLKSEKKKLQADIKEEMNRHAYFNRAAKPYLDAEKLVKQAENYTHLDDIAEKYEEAKARYEEELRQQALEEEKKRAEKSAAKRK
ncbi:MAG: MFS transporter [Clostridia bacterium]|nr:MFS transporter [Clostridia bacterium]